MTPRISISHIEETRVTQTLPNWLRGGNRVVLFALCGYIHTLNGPSAVTTAGAGVALTVGLSSLRRRT